MGLCLSSFSGPLAFQFEGGEEEDAFAKCLNDVLKAFYQNLFWLIRLEKFMDVNVNINGNGIMEMFSPLKRSYLLSTDFVSLNQKGTVPVEKTNFCGSSVL